MKLKKIATKKKDLPAKKTMANASDLLLAKKDKQIVKLTSEVDTLRSEMQTLLELGKTVNKQKELLNKVLRFHKADKIELEKAVKNRTKQFEQKNAELKSANKELAFQNKEKEKRAAELNIANKELRFQNKEKEKRAAELIVANTELAFQSNEKEKRANELSIANTELAYQNTEKEKRAEELSTANKDLTAFTYISSHDLQEPLRKIQNFATCILNEEEKNLTDTGKGYFKRMTDTAMRMQELIEDLLTYSRTKNSELIFESTDLNTIVHELEKDLENVISEKKAVIKVHLNTVKVIPFQFRQLLHNLVGNSLKFAKKDVPPLITLTSEIATGSKLNNKYLVTDKKYCHIILTDNCIGFEPEYNEKIFEVFQRLHSKEAYHGTGIGLAICKRIVENHKGIITANGELGVGSRFDIYISAE